MFTYIVLLTNLNSKSGPLWSHREKKYVIVYNLKEIKVLGVSLFSMVSLVVVVPVNNYHQMRVARLRAT